LSVGNPHTVVFVDDLDFDWHEIGSLLECHELFPQRTNVEFVKVMTRGKVRIKSWERGAGPTHATGTGACAVGAAGVMVGLLKREIEAICDYGSLLIEWSSDDNKIYQTGPAEYCFEGTA
jgi:diaminopimelate epimerase